MIAYPGDTARNVDGGQSCTTPERITAYPGDRVGNNCIFTPYNEYISRCPYDCVAVISTIKNGVPAGNSNGCQIGAALESPIDYTMNTSWNIDTGQSSAVLKSAATNRYISARVKCYRGQSSTAFESEHAYFVDRIGASKICDRGGNNQITRWHCVIATIN